MARLKIKAGDTVLIHAGKDRGKVGKVLSVLPRERRIVVEGRNLVKKHVRPRRAGQKGERVVVPAPFPVDRVLLVCPACQKATRVGIRRLEAKPRERLCKKCGVVIP